MKHQRNKSRFVAAPNGIESGTRPATLANNETNNLYAGTPISQEEDPELRSFLCEKLPRKQMPNNLLTNILEKIKRLS